MDKNWQDRVFESIQNIADIEYQAKSWFGGTELVSSFVEIVNVLYDDNCFEEFLEDPYWNTNSINSDLISEMHKLNEMINAYQEEGGYKEIIVSNEWKEIVKQADKVIGIWRVK